MAGKNITMKLLGLRAYLESKKNAGKASEAELKFFTDLLDIVDDLTMGVDRLNNETFNESFINPTAGPTRI